MRVEKESWIIEWPGFYPTNSGSQGSSMFIEHAKKFIFTRGVFSVILNRDQHFLIIDLPKASLSFPTSLAEHCASVPHGETNHHSHQSLGGGDDHLEEDQR